METTECPSWVLQVPLFNLYALDGPLRVRVQKTPEEFLSQQCLASMEEVRTSQPPHERMLNTTGIYWGILRDAVHVMLCSVFADLGCQSAVQIKFCATVRVSSGCRFRRQTLTSGV
jgi:hypothetical protein